jgi:hypothetical protein
MIGVATTPPRLPPVLSTAVAAMVSEGASRMVAPQNEPSVSSTRPKPRQSAATAQYGLFAAAVRYMSAADAGSATNGVMRMPARSPKRPRRWSASLPPSAAARPAVTKGRLASQPLSSTVMRRSCTRYRKLQNVTR